MRGMALFLSTKFKFMTDNVLGAGDGLSVL
jgi:hypothetical protein